MKKIDTSLITWKLKYAFFFRTVLNLVLYQKIHNFEHCNFLTCDLNQHVYTTLVF